MSPNAIATADLESHKKQRSVCVVTNGCLVARMDSALLERFFQERSDFRLCSDCMEADLIVFVGCGAIQEKETLSREFIEGIRSKKRPDARLLVTGCITKIRPELTSQEDEFKGLLGQISRLWCFETEQDLAVNFPHPEFWERCDDLFDPSVSRGMLSGYFNRPYKGLMPRISLTLNACLIRLFAKYRRLIDKEMLVSGNKTFFIKVSTGCMGKCAYCCIKLARGRVKSKPLDAVLKEFEQGLDQGYKDFALVGTDIGDYGKDLGLDLIDLLEQLVAHKGRFKLRLQNVNPRWLIPSAPRFCELLKSGKIAYILCAVESGSNRILDRMNRGHRIEDYIEAVRKVRKAYPRIIVKTQIVVGFPGEEDEDFRKSVELFNSDLFDCADICAYTKRPRTKAARLPDEVPAKIIAKRYRKLLFRSFFQLPLRRWLSICMLRRRYPIMKCLFGLLSLLPAA